MIEALTDQLAEKLRAALPFMDRVVGLARPHETTVLNGDGYDEKSQRRVRVPVPVTFTPEQCINDVRYLVPDESTTGIAFFEDMGTVPATLGAGAAFESTFRLIGWVNPLRLSGPLSEVALYAALDEALEPRRPQQLGDYRNVQLRYTTLPADGLSLLSRYTYATETLLVLPPYRLFGLEIRARYTLNTACLTAPLPVAADAGCTIPLTDVQ